MLKDIRARAGERMNAPGGESFLIRDGRGSVMFSAPHCVEQWRDGKIKFAEPETGLLAEMLHLQYRCPIIRKQTFCRDDANYDQVCSYKQALARYIKEHDIRCLIDLHQLASSRPEMINIGTGEGVNVGDARIIEAVKNCFLQNGIASVWVDQPFKASYPHTVSAAMHRICGIDCIQLEINSALLREDEKNEGFARVYRSLCDCFEKLTEMRL